MDATISAAWIAAGATVFVGATTALLVQLFRMEANRREDVRALHERINGLQNFVVKLMSDHEKANQTWREGIVRELGAIKGRREREG